MVPASNTLADWTPISAIPVAPEIAPVLLMLPVKTETKLTLEPLVMPTLIPATPAEIEPVLTISPAKVETFPGVPLLKPTAMPVTAVIAPPLLMPPVNVVARLTSMPVIAE
jgi:hypothetical protein